MTTAEVLQIAVGIIVALFGWSFRRNIGDLDAKISSVLTTLKDLADHKAETREALVELRLRIAALERGRHSTGEHEAAR